MGSVISTTIFRRIFAVPSTQHRKAENADTSFFRYENLSGINNEWATYWINSDWLMHLELPSHANDDLLFVIGDNCTQLQTLNISGNRQSHRVPYSKMDVHITERGSRRKYTNTCLPPNKPHAASQMNALSFTHTCSYVCYKTLYVENHCLVIHRRNFERICRIITTCG